MSERITESLSYGWIWSGPTGPKTPEYYKLATIDYGRIGLELLALTAICGIAFLVTHRRTAAGTAAGYRPLEPMTAATALGAAVPSAKNERTTTEVPHPPATEHVRAGTATPSPLQANDV